MFAYLQISGCVAIPSRIKPVHRTTLVRLGPVMVTTRSDVAARTASFSFGDSRIDVTPDDSAMDFTLDPPLPMSIPQLGVGTSKRITKAKHGGATGVPIPRSSVTPPTDERCG